MSIFIFKRASNHYCDEPKIKTMKIYTGMKMKRLEVKKKRDMTYRP